MEWGSVVSCPIRRPVLTRANGDRLSMGLLIFIPLLILLWFMLIRPQQKRLREREALIRRVQVGDEVATAGGFIGTVVAFEDEFGGEAGDAEGPGLAGEVVVLALAPGVEARILRRSVVQIRSESDTNRLLPDEDGFAEPHEGDPDDLDEDAPAGADTDTDDPGDSGPASDDGSPEGDLAVQPGENETP